jgi:hypothetical protein
LLEGITSTRDTDTDDTAIAGDTEIIVAIAIGSDNGLGQMIGVILSGQRDGWPTRLSIHCHCQRARKDTHSELLSEEGLG